MTTGTTFMKYSHNNPEYSLSCADERLGYED